MYSIVWAAETCFTVWGMMWGSLNSDASAEKNTPGPLGPHTLFRTIQPKKHSHQLALIGRTGIKSSG